MTGINKLVEDKLLYILSELEQQKDIGDTYSKESLPFEEEMEQIREYIEFAGEYSVAYETIVATLESHKFLLSSKAAVFLLEVGLVMGFKTEREEDNFFNIRKGKD